MSGAGELSREDMHQVHLETAYARDLALTLTRYAAPELIGRRAICYTDMLDYLYEQQKWTQTQQRPHQPVLAVPGSVLTDNDDAQQSHPRTVRNSQGVSAVASVATSAADTQVHGHRDPITSGHNGAEDDAGDADSFLGRVLPIAVGKSPCCKTDIHVQRFGPKDWRALEAVGVTPLSLDQSHNGELISGTSTTTTSAGNGQPSTRTYMALMAYEDRQCAQNAAMRYLLRGVLESSPQPCTSSPNGIEGSSSSSTASDSLVEAAKAAGLELSDLPSLVFRDAVLRNDLTANVDLFYGMREIANSTPEYITTLAQWAKTLNAGDDAATQTQTQAQGQRPLMNETPEFLEHLLNASGFATHRIENGSALAAADGEGSSWLYSHPLVKPKAEQIMDSLLPPRLLLFFDLDPVAAAREYTRRATHDHRIRELLLEYYRDAGDGTSTKMAQLLSDVRAEHTQKHAEDAVVGTAFLLVERVSNAQCPREGLLQLEQDLEILLLESRARCWGAPMDMNPQSANFLGTVRGNEAMSRTLALREARHTKPSREAKVLKPSPPPGPRTRGGENKHATTTTAAAGTTKTTSFFVSTLHEGAVPAVQDPNAGGTATVMSTLNVLELNAERTTILLHLLRNELLRQVTLDSTERGILLSRILAEADVSLTARAVVLRESLARSQESLNRCDTAAQAHHANEDVVVLEKEVAALQAKLASAQARKTALEKWSEECKTADKNKAAQTAHFHELLFERLKRHTDEVRDAQDRERRGSVDTTA